VEPEFGWELQHGKQKNERDETPPSILPPNGSGKMAVLFLLVLVVVYVGLVVSCSKITHYCVQPTHREEPEEVVVVSLPPPYDATCPPMYTLRDE
jgi:hypothetical protein